MSIVVVQCNDTIDTEDFFAQIMIPIFDMSKYDKSRSAVLSTVLKSKVRRRSASEKVSGP